jgi:hypothetical protein
MDKQWRKSSFSGAQGGDCVETAIRGGHVLARDSKLGESSPVLTWSLDTWRDFVAAIKAS